jgi:hypothetical protein
LRQLYSRIELFLLDLHEGKFAGFTGKIDDDLLNSTEAKCNDLKDALHLVPIHRPYRLWDWVDLVYRFTGVCAGVLTVGVFASLPSFLREDQKKEVARLVASKFTVDPGTGNSLYNRLVGVWNRRGAAHLGTLAKGLFPTKECGSSGGVCALMGCHLVLQLRDASNIVYWSMCARCVCSAWLRDRLLYAHSRPPFFAHTHTHTCQHRRTPPTAPPPHAHERASAGRRQHQRQCQCQRQQRRLERVSQAVRPPPPTPHPSTKRSFLTFSAFLSDPC